MLTQDNVDIACQVIEKIAMDRAVVEIDEALGSAYEARHTHAEVCLVSPYYGLCLLVPNSIGWASRSVIQPPLDLTSLRHFPNL